MGQQTTYTREKADEICERIAEGEPLRAICRDEHMPSWTTVYAWINADPELAERIAHARQLGYDAIAHEILEISDTPAEQIAGERGLRRDPGHIAWQKNRIETRLKLLAKWDPKRYGDKQDINLSGQLDIASAIVAARKRS